MELTARICRIHRGPAHALPASRHAPGRPRPLEHSHPDMPVTARRGDVDQRGRTVYLGQVTYSPVPELNLLKGFQDEYGYESYSECFGLGDWNDVSGLIAGWSK